MENIRDGNTSVFMLKKEVRRELANLISRNDGCLFNAEFTPRTERQIQDATKFLEMVQTKPYSECKTVDELKQRISMKRNSLKTALVSLDTEAEGHQLSIFDVIGVTSKEELEARRQAAESLKLEIRWLHKCLGICKNKDYFH